MQRRLAGGIVRTDDAAVQCRDRGDEQAPAPPATFDHAGERCLGHQDRRAYVDGHRGVPRLDAHVTPGQLLADTRARDEQTDGAERGGGAVDEPLGGVRVREIGLEGGGLEDR